MMLGQSVDFLFALAVGLVAGSVSGIVGAGSSIMLVPVLVYEFGPKEAARVPLEVVIRIELAGSVMAAPQLRARMH